MKDRGLRNSSLEISDVKVSITVQASLAMVLNAKMSMSVQMVHTSVIPWRSVLILMEVTIVLVRKVRNTPKVRLSNSFQDSLETG